MARTVVTVVGMADRMAGISSKTNKSYDFVKMAFQYVNPWDKNSVCVAAIDGATYDKLGIQTGDKFDAIVSQFNGKTYVDLIDQVF